MPDTRVKVLYIAGCGRSGSTLLARLLGQADGWVSAGELISIWSRGVLGDWPCDCGERFTACPHWKAVFDQTWRGMDRVDARLASQTDRRLRAQLLPTLLRTPRDRRYTSADCEPYKQITQQLYAGLAALNGSRVVVDSSKFAKYALFLDRLPEIDLRVVHLVRDSRAVSFSYFRPIPRHPGASAGNHLRTHGVAGSSQLWLRENLSAEALKAVGIPYVRMRYEDLCRDPAPFLQRVADFVGEGPLGLAVKDRSTFEIRPTHGPSGNPSRFRTGDVTVREDNEWTAKMKTSNTVLSTLLTWPLLARYGYVRRGRG